MEVKAVRSLDRGSVWIVTKPFIASTDQPLRGQREFPTADALVFLRVADRDIIFARAADIDLNQPLQTLSLPQYLVETEIFYASTRSFVR